MDRKIKSIYVGLLVLILGLFLLKEKISVVGYAVVNAMTNSIVVMYLLLLILVLVVIGYKLLNKK